MKSCPMACFRCNAAENFILSVKYRQRKGDLNANKKSLVFVTIRHRKFHFYVQLLYTKISDLRKNTHLQKDAAFLHFRFEGKFRKYDISVKRKRTKADKKMIFSVLFTNFRTTKILLFMQCKLFWKRIIKNHQKS